MKFIPRQRFEIVTPYDSERIRSILERNMYKRQGASTYYQVPTAKDGKLLDGTLQENGFELKEYVDKKEMFYNKNTFEAVAHGSYTKGHNKTTVSIILEMPKTSKLFFLVWNVLICFVVLTSIVSMFQNYSSQALGIMLLSLVMMVAGYFMMLVSFRTSADKLERRLREVLGRGKVCRE